LIHIKETPEPEDTIEVNYGKKEIISRVEFERRLRLGLLPVSVEPGVYKVIKGNVKVNDIGLDET